jgi:ribonuclease-3
MSIEDKIGIKFRGKKLLKRALTHSSVSKDSNERLEFLGDAVLEFIVSKNLYLSYPFDEGVLTNKRSELVCTETLASAARKIDLGRDILIDRNETLSESVLAGCFEALIGAIYLDQGIRKTEGFIKKTVLFASHKVVKNWKGILQEHTARNLGLYPEYKLIKETGPQHKKRFEVEVWVGNKLWGRGKGRSIQSAEKEAAKMAVKKVM